MTPAERIRNWLETTIANSGESAASWAAKAGLAASTVQRPLKPDYQFVTSSRTLAKLATALGVAAPEIEALTDGNPTQQSLRYLPIRYEVGAGIWRSMDDVQDFYGTGPVVSEGAYADFPQWLERVVTDSMDRDYPIGTLIHVVDATAIGYAPRNGDHVVIERREDGGKRERSVKEVVMTAKGPQFWPRSTNPKWAGPISLSDGLDQEHCEVETVALVLGSYRSRRG